MKVSTIGGDLVKERLGLIEQIEKNASRMKTTRIASWPGKLPKTSAKLAPATKHYAMNARNSAVPGRDCGLF